jgi:hypothetical protein
MNQFVGLFFLFILLFIVIIFFTRRREGMTDASGNSIPTNINGIAGNIDAYSADIKGENIKLQDMFLVSKYKTSYENAILDLDDFLNNLMLKTALTIDKTKPEISFIRLAEMNQARTALNQVIKFLGQTS